MQPIAHIHCLFPSKFGIPRQSNIIEDLSATIIFEPEFRNIESLRGIETFDYLWLLWQFSANLRDNWSPTVRPPRLGGNQRMGVFATRSPFRPNAIGLSSVKLLDVSLHTAEGPQLHVGGADLMDGTPIFDIKPYIPYTDAHPNAHSGFAPTPADHLLDVECPETLTASIPQQIRNQVFDILSHDPRPSYHHDPDRVYAIPFSNLEIRFQVHERQLTIVEVSPRQ